MGQVQCCHPQFKESEFDLKKSSHKQSQHSKILSNKPQTSFALPFNQPIYINQDVRRVANSVVPLLPSIKSSNSQKLNPYKLKNGVVYDGQWNNGIMHGYGKYHLPNGGIIEANTVNGVISGIGRVIMPKNHFFEGNIDKNVAHGKGSLQYEGYSYQGDFVNNVKHGEGDQNTKQYKYIGKYQYGDRVNGKVMWGKDYSIIYQGQLKDNKPHKWGTLKNQIGTYQGGFEDGLKSGKGTFTWVDGHIFIGEYLKGKKNGFGKLFDPNGNEVRNGEWKDDKYIE